MGYQNREIEIKLEVLGVIKMNEVVRKLGCVFDEDRCERIIAGASKDTYFTPPAGAKADFMRVRYGHKKGDQSYFTIKYTDKGGNVDRVEKDVPIKDPDLMVSVLKDIHGEPRGSIYKKYKVYFLSDEFETISVYQIKDDSRVFIEIEATSHAKMNKLVEEVVNLLPYQLKKSDQSLYQIFLGSAKN